MAELRRLASLLAVAGASCGPPDPGPERPACPPGGTVATWSNHARPFLSTWCTGCHHSAVPVELRQGAPVDSNFDTFDGVREARWRIYDRAVVARTMPPAGGPSDEARALLGEWIACGMPGGEDEPPAPCTGARRVRPGDLVVGGPADLDAFCAEYDAVEGALRIEGGGAVALDCLCEVGGDLVVEAPSGVTEVALPELRAVGGDLRVVGAAAVAAVRLDELVAVGGAAELRDDAGLTVAELGSLESVGGDLRVEGNLQLGEVPLARLFTVGGDLVVRDNPSATSVDLDRILAVGGDLRIEDNDELTWMFGDAYQLESVGGDLVLARNPKLEGFYGFVELVEVGGDVELVDNDAFETFFGFTRLESVGGHLRIAGNARLGIVDGFDFLESVPGSVAVEDNPVMRFVTGFRVLSEVGLGLPSDPELRLADLPALTGIAGLDAVRHVGALQVERTGLSDLDPLHGIVQVDGDLRVVDNPNLPPAEVDALVGAIGAGNIGGSVTNQGNGP